jgi:hypothetical protein
MKQCEMADRVTRRAIVRAVNGVKGDPDEGEDGDLLSAMGYMKHTVRSEVLSEARRRSARLAAGNRKHRSVPGASIDSASRTPAIAGNSQARDARLATRDHLP